MTPKNFLSLTTKVIREECINLRLERSKDKEDTRAERDPERSDDHQDTPEQENSQDKPRELTINESGEAAQKFHKVLLFFWCMIHESEDINPVPIILDIPSNTEKRNKKIQDFAKQESKQS